jgi:competence protein ComEC
LTDAVIDPVGGLDVDPKISVLWGQVAKDPGWGMDRNRLQFSNANNHCVVVRVEFGQASVLVTGDLQDVAIRDLVKLHASTNALSAVVYEVGHHGSSNGTTPEFLDVMRPRYAVLEVGNPARQDEWTAWQHGHPRKEILAMLEAVLPTSRPVIDVRVGLDKRTFEPRAVSKGIYATGWDGTIVLEAGADGVFRVVSTERTPAGLTRR